VCVCVCLPLQVWVWVWVWMRVVGCVRACVHVCVCVCTCMCWPAWCCPSSGAHSLMHVAYLKLPSMQLSKYKTLYVGCTCHTPQLPVLCSGILPLMHARCLGTHHPGALDRWVQIGKRT